jgi:hypothetical protein
MVKLFHCVFNGEAVVAQNQGMMIQGGVHGSENC